MLNLTPFKFDNNSINWIYIPHFTDEEDEIKELEWFAHDYTGEQRQGWAESVFSDSKAHVLSIPQWQDSKRYPLKL